MRATVAALMTLGLACGIAARAADTDPKLLMTQRGKLLFSDDLKQPLARAWTGMPGRWETVDGALQGAERKEDMHAAVRRHALPFQNAVIQYDFRLQGARQATFSINDATGHLARVLVRPDGFTVQKDDHDHAGPDKVAVFEKKATAFAPGRWYTLVIELLGEEMVAHVDDQVGFGAHPAVAGPKTNIGFTVSGEAAQFRNLRVWEATPHSGWAETKHQLLAKRK